MTGLFTVLAGCGSGTDWPSTTGAGDPITVSQLLARSADTPVAVQGLLHIDRGVASLCGAILESHPPQCGQPSVELVGFDSSAAQGTTTAQGVTWKEGAILNLERVADGRFRVVGIEAWSDVHVVLGLYSGVPDPAWTLTADQSKELSAALAGLTRVEEDAPSGGLGYHGFTFVTPDGTMVAYAGKVVNADSVPPYVLDDPDRTIERFLFDTAGPHVPAQGLNIVADALTRA